MAVKGISNYGDHNQSPSDGWESFASTMAASLVTNILSDPAIFQGWSHCHQGKVLLSMKRRCLRSRSVRIK